MSIRCIYRKEKWLTIFGDTFVENNHDKCKIFYNWKEQKLKSSILIEDSNANDKIEINLIVYKEITNMSYMFENCSSLLSLPDISKLNTNNVNDISFMFYDCSSLLSLPDISKWNTNKVTNMNYMFAYCSSLSSLPDISKWNTNNVTYMHSMLSNCSSL